MSHESRWTVGMETRESNVHNTLPRNRCVQTKEYQKIEDKIAAVNGALSGQEMMTMILY